MTNYQDVVDAWDRAGPGAIHPSRSGGEDAYRASGVAQARLISAALAGHGPSPHDLVVDYGCGDGRVAIPLAEFGWQVLAVDTSPKMLARLRERAGPIAVATATPADLPGRNVGAVYSLAVLIHHSWVDGERIVSAMVSMVRPGGLLVLDWPVADSPCERDSWIGVTTWSRQRRDAVADRLGLDPAPIGLPWSTYRRRA